MGVNTATGNAIVEIAGSVTTSATVTGLPTSLGQKTAANSTSVVLASDQGTVTITGAVTTSSTAGGTTADAAYTDATGAATGTQVGLLKGLFVALKGILTTALQGDARAGTLYSGDHTLGTANTVTSFTLPAGVRGFRIFNGSVGALRFAINADPPSANTATSGTAVTISSGFGAYNTVPLNSTEVRLFEPGATVTTLRINSATASATFTLGVW